MFTELATFVRELPTLFMELAEIISDILMESTTLVRNYPHSDANTYISDENNNNNNEKPKPQYQKWGKGFELLVDQLTFY